MEESEFHSMTPMDMMFLKAKMKCTICDAKAGTCNCWLDCACGWKYRNGESCRNPECELTQGKEDLNTINGESNK